MQSTYQRHGFELNLVNVSRIVDDVAGKGFYDEDHVITDQEAYMSWRRATRRGGYDALNVYFFSDLSELIGGQCNLPTNVTAGTDAFYQDGCWINGDTMPGLGPRSANGTGLDAIHNFMDYSSCMKEFTVGQEVRMHQQFDMFRRKP
ncbi:Extracellular metalloprotease [Colletotrichum higginsianum]|uniref:Extracellular metalloprotease n=1 Tax=Colletotrichum higginsianum TaxID=80884 RepID=A0A4V4NDZ9_9PEZI|nr:Extracellular metalloprotease [Colletotrichum higginsianum]